MDDKINSTKKADAGKVLSSTLSEMEEWDMNKLNDAGRANKKD
jgi:hypothetical protein